MSISKGFVCATFLAALCGPASASAIAISPTATLAPLAQQFADREDGKGDKNGHDKNDNNDKNDKKEKDSAAAGQLSGALLADKEDGKGHDKNDRGNDGKDA